MIKPVSNNNYTSAYRDNSGKNRNDTKDAPAFLLGDDDGVIYEPTKKKKPEPVKKVSTNEASQVERLSTVTISSANQKTANASERKSDEGFIAKIKQVFNKIFRFIWYGDETDTKVTEPAMVKPVEVPNNEVINKAVPAHNTNVLTRYDRYGHIVNMSGGDTARILQKDTTYTV